MTETCEVCRQESTPWQYVKELDGHICDCCAYTLADIQSLIDGPNGALAILKFFRGHKNVI